MRFLKVLGVVAILAIAGTNTAKAQYKYVDAAFALNGQDILFSPSFGIGKILFNRLTISTGIRLNYLSSSDVTFSNESYNDFVEGELYSTEAPSFSSFSVSIPLDLHLRVLEKLGLGFNIDLFGFTVGPELAGQNYISLPNNNETAAEVQPSNLNLLLGGAGDLGSLSSEFYLSYAVLKRLKIRAGFNYFFSEVQIDNPSDPLEYNKLRNQIGMGFIGARFNISK